MTRGKEQATVSRRRGGVQDPPLSIDDVVGAAVSVTERAGLDRLTVRLVAEELRVTPAAVHYHLRGKDDLLDRVCEAVSARIESAVDPGAPCADRYVELVLNMDRTLSRYPGVAARALAATGSSPAARRIADSALSILRDGGLERAEAAEVVAASQFLLTGWLVLRDRAEAHPALDAAGIGSPADATVDRLANAVRRLLAGFGVGQVS
ncbi:helix-turn-helix domain-containing protein [Amycolatopsis sp.]|uniref:TetR/AcrR family transcriptional regulator n=1 Tax=Amycolatopsis sp. TaxID=37632 RepID=UPI002D02C175|nr:helix-turn-helix domain-containing protein [Amycolatopsis sp.]HVV08178.1 helix-turn-helix domain-containing protein [Amycolatopsis sp.]